MKTILSLPSYQRHTSAAAVIRAMQRLFRNPARHIRGPFFSAAPGNGTEDQFGEGCPAEEAVSACAAGAKDLLSRSTGTRIAVRRALNHACVQLSEEKALPEWTDNYVSVSDGIGLPALRLVMARAIRNLRAVGRA